MKRAVICFFCKLINSFAFAMFLPKPVKVRKGYCYLKSISVLNKDIRHFIVDLLSFLVLQKKAYRKKNMVFLNGKDFVIFDDFFPSKESGWRYAEIDSYLKSIPNSVCCASGITLKNFWKKSDGLCFEYYFSDKIMEYNKTSNKVLFYEGIFKSNKNFLAYCIFINNVFNFDFLTQISMPFVFTLYPGGGLRLDDFECDYKLLSIFQSKYFRHVIVTQTCIYDYLLKKKMCPIDKITLILGGPALEDMLEEIDVKKLKKFGRDKDVLDICFVANKYSKIGRDKGYDVFIEMAKKLHKNHKNIHFHIVGNGFDEKTLDVAEIKSVINFYGVQTSDFFKLFYQDKDIICSPNRPFLLHNGAFDGFPLGCSSDAMLQHVACFMSDELQCNNGRYTNEIDAEMLVPNATVYAERIEYYYNNPFKLIQLAEKGAKKTRELFSYENQIIPRINLMKKLIENEKHLNN